MGSCGADVRFAVGDKEEEEKEGGEEVKKEERAEERDVLTLHSSISHFIYTHTHTHTQRRHLIQSSPKHQRESCCRFHLFIQPTFATASHSSGPDMGSSSEPNR